MTDPKLNQILAIEKGAKSRVHGELTKMNELLSKPALLAGFAKSYQPKDDAGDVYPPEQQKVQVDAAELLRRAGRLLTELLDVTAAKDWANTQARADVLVDGEVLLEQVPATYLLFLEKQLAELAVFVKRIPILDPAEEWHRDEAAGLFKTQPTTAIRTKKVQRPIVLYQATKEHPAQTQLISEDVVVGTWLTIKHSGALPAARKQALIGRIERLIDAVKFARERANGVPAPRREVGERLFEYLFQ